MVAYRSTVPATFRYAYNCEFAGQENVFVDSAQQVADSYGAAQAVENVFDGSTGNVVSSVLPSDVCQDGHFDVENPVM